MAKMNRSDARVHRHRRVRKKIFGNHDKPRLCIYRSLAEIYAQIIDDEHGQTMTSSSSLDHEVKTRIKGMKKIEQAVVVGKILAERAKVKKINEVVFDRGGYKYSGRVKALAESARQAGLKF